MNQVQKLETLLSRVQERRTQPHAAPAAHAPVAVAHAPMPSPAAAPAPAPRAASVAAAAPMRSHPTERAAVVEERVSLPGSRAAAPVAAAPARTEPRLPDVEPAAPMFQPQRAAGGRTSTPLEMALEDEFNKPPMDAAPSRHVEASRSQTPVGQRAEVSAEPFTIEPEPLQEPARPIAQVMSKHAVEMDITFGAMLKRSLSLRPR